MEKKPLVQNAADPKQVDEGKRKERDTRKQELLDFRNVMETKIGRRVIYRYIVACGVFTQSFTGNSETFFNEGKRYVGLKLLSDINEACADLYATMMDEAQRDNDAQ